MSAAKPAPRAEAPEAQLGPPPEPIESGPDINLTLSADGLLLIGVASWLVWRRVLRGVVMRRLGALLGSPMDPRYLVELLAQVAVLTGAARVALGTFYGPRMSASGYGFSRLTILSCYVAPGRLPLDLETRDMPIERIANDLEDLIAHGHGSWRLVQAGTHLPIACSDYLLRNRITFLYGRLVMLEELPIGILNLQFDDPHRRPEDPTSSPYTHRLEGLFAEISRVVRGRMLRPPLWRRLLSLWARH